MVGLLVVDVALALMALKFGQWPLAQPLVWVILCGALLELWTFRIPGFGSYSVAVPFYLCAALTPEVGLAGQALMVGAGLAVRLLARGLPDSEALRKAAGELMALLGVGVFCHFGRDYLDQLSLLLLSPELYLLLSAWGRRQTAAPEEMSSRLDWSRIRRRLTGPLLVQSLAGSALAAAFQAGPTVTLLVLPFVLSLHQAARGACLLLEADERERLEQVLEETEESLKETSQTAASQAQTIALLDRLHHTLARLNDPQDVADTVVAQAFGLGRLTSVALFVWQEGKARPVAYRSPHAKTLESWEILDCQEPSLETCWKRGKFLQILPKHRKEVFINESYGLCIPFPEFGVLYLGSTSPLGREVLQAGLRLAEVATPALLKARSFRRQSNALVYHKTAHEQLQEWVERLSLLLEGSRSVATILEPEPLLDRIEDILDRLVPHQGRVIVVHSPQLRRMRGLGPEVHPALEGLEGAVQSSGRALALQDGEVSRLGPLGRDCSALLITPMLTEQGLVGYILLTRSQGEPFQRSDQESLMILSYHLAAMITSVRAHSEVREALRLLKESQQQLTQSAKMAAIGQLAAGVAHELNSPLGAILFGVDICASSLPDPPQSLTRRLEKVRSAAVKAQAIVAKLLFYSRQGNLSDQPFELNSVAHDAVDLLEHHFRLAGVTCTLTLAEDTPVSGNQNELHQVVTNLLINAMDACQEQPADRKTITLETRREGEEIQLIVTDRGCGIPSDHLARVFEPFFTTKPVGKGTGLGLSVCHQIVSQHRGRMSVDSLEGQGTRVLLSLPARAEGLR